MYIIYIQSIIEVATGKTKEMKERAYGIIPPNQDLQRRTGGPLKPLEDKLIESVTIALQELAEDKGDWIKTDKAILRAAESGTIPEDIVNAHVDALRAVVNLNLREADCGPVTELLRGLDRPVKKQIG